MSRLERFHSRIKTEVTCLQHTGADLEQNLGGGGGQGIRCWPVCGQQATGGRGGGGGGGGKGVGGGLSRAKRGSVGRT